MNSPRVLAGVAGALGAVLVGGLLTAMLLTLISVDDDTTDLVPLLEGQLETTQAALVVLEQTRDEAVRTRENSDELLSTARQALDVATEALGTAQRTEQQVGQLRGDSRAIRQDVAEARALTQRLLTRVEQLERIAEQTREVAEQTRDEVREINQRTGGTGSGGVLP